MKKLLTYLMIVLILSPFFTVKANSQGEAFVAGSSVIAMVKDDNTPLRFTVLRDSPAATPYVWLMYGGTICPAPIPGPAGVCPVLWDEERPMEDSVTGVFDDAPIKESLASAMQYSFDMERIMDYRLPVLDDFTRFVIQPNAAGNYEIRINHGFLAPSLMPNTLPAGEEIRRANFWTRECSGPCTGNEVSMWVVQANTDWDGNSLNPIAEIKPVLISVPAHQGERYALKPVVQVDKKYIVCEDTTTTLTNIPTSEVALPIEFLIVAALAGIALIGIRKKEVFTQI